MSSYEVLGIGAPVVDHIIPVDSHFLDNLPGTKRGMIPVDYAMLTKIICDAKVKPKTFLGGSGANTIRGLAKFGYRCAFTGKIGQDSASKLFLQNLQELNIVPLLSYSNTPMAQVVCLISERGERTMRSFLGASKEMKPEDLKPEMFKGVHLVHIEGYQMLYENVVQRTMELAKAAGAKVSFDLGSFEVVEKHKKQIIGLLGRYVDVLFANEDETYALTKLAPEPACSILRDICDTVVVLMGVKGCWVGSGEKQIQCPAYPVEPLDTTGAGDMFASGFLHGYLKGKSLEESAHYGALAGAAVVQVHGTELPSTLWSELINKCK